MEFISSINDVLDSLYSAILILAALSTIALIYLKSKFVTKDGCTKHCQQFVYREEFYRDQNQQDEKFRSTIDEVHKEIKSLRQAITDQQKDFNAEWSAFIREHSMFLGRTEEILNNLTKWKDKMGGCND